jgi:hypothetical protein
MPLTGQPTASIPLYPIFPYVAASATYDSTIGFIRVHRSNGGVAMTDTLPTIGALQPNGWEFKVKNIDASASNTFTPATGTIDGLPNYVLTAGSSATFYSDGTNYWTD